ncbi:MAG: DUF4340 domain-containing protein [Kiritimatiellae bacterium]|nr:DUF4340 domain-containing protein [Kiritimatiellia bacterium]
MKGTVTFILFVLVLTLGAFIYLFERDTWSTAEQNAHARKAFTFDPDEISQIWIERDGAQLICEREEGLWHIRTPVDDHADEGLIHRFLYYIELLRKNTAITAQDRLEHNLTLSDYGMDAPQAMIRLSGKNRTKSYLIGKKSTLDNRVYVKEESQDVIVSVDDQLLKMIPTSPSEWRVRDLFRENASDITRFSIRRADGFIQAGRQDSGQWVIQQPIKARASVTAIQRLLESLLPLQIDRFVTDSVKDLTAYGLDHPMAELSLWQKNSKTPDTLLIGKAAETTTNGVFVKWSSKTAVCVVSNGLLHLLSVPLNELRTRRLTTLAAPAVRHVKLARGEQIVEFLKTENGQWEMLRPTREKADTMLIDMLVETWCDSGILSYVADDVTNWPSFGFDPPRCSVELSITTNQTESASETSENRSFAGWQISTLPPENGVLLVRADATSVYGVAAQLADTVNMNPLYYRARELLNIPRDQVLRISQTLDQDETCELVYDDTSKTFTVVRPEGRTLDAESLDIFLRQILRLSAERFVVENPENLAEFGLDQPSAVIRLGLSGSAGIGRTLLLGGEAGNGHIYAMIQGRDVVFELNRVTGAILCAELLKKAPVPKTPTPEENPSRENQPAE